MHVQAVLAHSLHALRWMFPQSLAHTHESTYTTEHTQRERARVVKRSKPAPVRWSVAEPH
jgi:hypothetical protein